MDTPTHEGTVWDRRTNRIATVYLEGSKTTGYSARIVATHLTQRPEALRHPETPVTQTEPHTTTHHTADVYPWGLYA